MSYENDYKYHTLFHTFTEVHVYAFVYSVGEQNDYSNIDLSIVL